MRLGMIRTTAGEPSEMVHTKYVIHVKVVQCAFHKGDWVVPNQESFVTPTPTPLPKRLSAMTSSVNTGAF